LRQFQLDRAIKNEDASEGDDPLHAGVKR
jgi:hypothetical protein